MLTLMVVVALVGGWFSWKWERAKSQRELVEDIYALYDYEFDPALNFYETMPDAPYPRWVVGLLGRDFLCDVVGVVLVPGLSRTPVTDGDIQRIAQQLSTIRLLVLHSGQMTDTGLAYLSDLKRLEVLDVNSPHITDEGLRHLAKLTSLRKLTLGGHFTGTGLSQLSDLPDLESLYLSNPELTPEWLTHLRTLRTLRGLYVVLPFTYQDAYNGGIVENAKMELLADIAEALPHCSVYISDANGTTTRFITVTSTDANNGR
jgi:hypothetical protein